MSRALIGIDRSGSFRVYLTATTDIVNEAMKIHRTSPTASAALGRVLTGAGLMSIQLKEPDDRLTVIFKGDGPAGSITACGYGDGRIKGYIANPSADLPQRGDGKLDVGGLVGRGELSVVRDAGLKEPYSGTVSLVSGEIAEDLTAYYYISEQRSTSIALGVKVARDMTARAAGGMFIQMMPGAEERCIDELEALLKNADPITTTVEKAVLRAGVRGDDAVLEEMKEDIFGGLPEEYSVTTAEMRDIKLECDCSRERTERALIALGEKTLTQLIEEDGGAELSCRFCNAVYRFDRDELCSLRAEAGKKGRK
ncbi:MAG: Hsp33 family molecular chaperone HslO [Anaerovoracaceae bacterium]|nr:Hsp33 family molecular chaperone HslO [Anaerovoracaceae bacterium]